MQKQSEINKRAWSYRAREFWTHNLGQPEELAEALLQNPEHALRRHLHYLGDIDGKKIINPLGSCGKKAIPLAILGADVTVVDISEENRQFAMAVATEAGVKLHYKVSDFLDYHNQDDEVLFDIAYLEGGILHYFADLTALAEKLYGLLNAGGKLVLNDFHPFRKLLKERDIFQDVGDALELAGDYFDTALREGEVAYEKYLSSKEGEEFPKCLLRYWTMGEIITAFAAAGFVIKELVEGPRFDEYKNIPGEFTLVAVK